MGAIALSPSTLRAAIDRESCVECYQCYRGMSQEHLNPVFVRTVRRVLSWARLRFEPEPDVCPTASFEPEELTWPRVVRRAFSDVTATHESTGRAGDVTVLRYDPSREARGEKALQLDSGAPKTPFIIFTEKVLRPHHIRSPSFFSPPTVAGYPTG